MSGMTGDEEQERWDRFRRGEIDLPDERWDDTATAVALAAFLVMILAAIVLAVKLP